MSAFGAVMLALALVLAATATGMLVWMALPGETRPPQLLGYRETKRKEGLARHRGLRLVWPLAERLTFYARYLPLAGFRHDVAKKLVDAGEPLGMSVDEFIGLNLALALCGIVCAAILDQAAHLGAALYVVFFLVGVMVPSMYLSEIAQERFKSINRGLPPVLDLVVMAMTAGADFMGSVGQVVSKWSRKRDPLYDELSRFLNDLMLGKTRREALDTFAARAPTELVKTFVGAVIEAEQRGTPLVEVLAIQADVARTRRFQRAEQIAGRAGVLVKLPLIVILAACMLVMFGGVIVKALRGQLW
ncbi:MAG: Type secretion system protein TadC, associated with Flp pilus assembly [bacterium]|nr:Type secretion system protein TadC, associated with Flp pilus assembly [bacterium]